MKNLYIIRGVSGSGKSTFAHTLASALNSSSYFEADMFFLQEDGSYAFDASRLYMAHRWCQECVRDSMLTQEENIIVANTFTTEEQMAPYLDLAKIYGYTVTSLVVENRHGNKNVHNVPRHVLDKQECGLIKSLRLQ